MNSYAVELNNLTKHYKIYKSNFYKFWDLVTYKDRADYHIALENISFKIGHGEVLGIMGLNGSGKSTLLKILTGVTYPTSGNYTVNGRISSLLELSAGFDEFMTGYENIFLKGYLLGLEKKEVSNILEKIIDFADIGKYIYQPVRLYSSGMKSRLGFAISVFVNPDIFIIDEAISVGDESFKIKCFNVINKIKSKGTTILFVSHSLNTLSAFCDKGIWIHNGKIQDSGDINQVIFKYREFLKSIDTKKLDTTKDIQKVTDIFQRMGSSLRNKVGEKTSRFTLNDEINFNFTYKVKKSLEFVIIKFYIKDRFNNLIFENNFTKAEYKLNGKIGTYNGRVKLESTNLLPGIYLITIELYDDSIFNKIFILKDYEIEVIFNTDSDIGNGLVYLEHNIFSEEWRRE